jgi:CPA2 family monovalent cation:H+ antiporter-2
LKIVVRAQSEEAALLRKESTAEVLIGEHELALGMTRRVLEQLEKKT